MEEGGEGEEKKELREDHALLVFTVLWARLWAPASSGNTLTAANPKCPQTQLRKAARKRSGRTNPKRGITHIPDPAECGFPCKSSRGGGHFRAQPCCRRLKWGPMVLTPDSGGGKWAYEGSAVQPREDHALLVFTVLWARLWAPASSGNTLTAANPKCPQTQLRKAARKRSGRTNPKSFLSSVCLLLSSEESLTFLILQSAAFPASPPEEVGTSGHSPAAEG
ncbi:hypothetical protein H920_16611 [Fukomys damarensis]|uniref:Uncharacterized protein n=1 Tax=Fukomys damarensis TaxID=885580 RepID=A0A091CVA6_FUKDA|nr:hypothetical protein H920_16611 [Fukomys damarensis]